MSNPAQGPITLYAPKPVSMGMFPPSNRLKFQSKFKLIFSVLLSLGIGAGFYLFTDEVRGVIAQGGSAVTLDRILDETFNLSLAGYLEGTQLKSTVTSGSPLVIASTDLVANLNADLLDGQHGSYYLDQAADTSGWVDDGTVVRLRTAADQVGIGTATPDGKLHIYSGTAGAVSAPDTGDGMVIEGSSNIGMTFLVPDLYASRIYFGSASDNAYTQLQSYYVGGYAQLYTKGTLKLDAATGKQIVVNDNGSDVNFWVESDGNANMLFVDAGLNKVGVGGVPTDGTLHIQSGSAGAVTANSVIDDLVVENSSGAGISILAPVASTSYFAFGNPNNSAAGYIEFGNSTHNMAFLTNDILRLSLNTTSAVFNENSSDVDFRVEGNSDANLIFADAGADSVGIGTSDPEGKLHVYSDSAGTVTANANADDLVVENSTSGGISILVPNASPGAIYFGVPGANKEGWIQYQGSTDIMQVGIGEVGLWNIGLNGVTFTESYTVASSSDLRLAAGAGSEVVVNESSIDIDFRVEGDGDANLIFADAGLDKIGIGRVPTTNKLEVEGNASKSVAGDWLSNSDIRIKTDVQTVKDALAVIGQLRPVKFKYTNEYLAAHPAIKDQYYYNFIAQEFQEVFPDAVKQGGDGYLQVDAYVVRPYLVAAVQELAGKVKKLESSIDSSGSLTSSGEIVIPAKLETEEGVFKKITSTIVGTFEKLVAKTAKIASAVIDTLTVGEIQIDASDPKPACDAEARGKIWFVKGGSGVADTLEVCAKNADDAYDWRAVDNE